MAAELFSRPGGCPLQGLSLALNPKISDGEVTKLLRALGRQPSEASWRLQTLDLAGTGAAPAVLAKLLARTLLHCQGLTVDLSSCLSQQTPGSSVSGRAEVRPGAATLTPAETLLELGQFVRQKRLLL
ncbi:unnamed protein product [Polarella glacialis]|nr:unnamed protein product [Polarella glacialis]